MARHAKRKAGGRKASKKSSQKKSRFPFSYCSVAEVPQQILSPNVNPGRAALINGVKDKWVNGTTLRYYFFDKDTDGERVFFVDGTSEWKTWVGAEKEKAVVRAAFDVWKSVGIGLQFMEEDSPEEAEIRIGFMEGDGAWSYLGRQALKQGSHKRTMNFGWSLTRTSGEIDTAIHEIGHACGFPHEHQNPNAGIVWDEEAVYAALAKPPNSWSRDKTFHNIIRKINPDTVQGSNWDQNSIMHYPFEPGLIKTPTLLGQTGLNPEPGLSERDKTWIRTFYPPMDPRRDQELKPLKSLELAISEGEQVNFVIRPETTRNYNIQTFGTSDTVMVLFEEKDGELEYRSGDDDSGQDTNAHIETKLIKGHKYVLRIRLYYSDRAGQTAVMMW